jgi:hypothetical protein
MLAIFLGVLFGCLLGCSLQGRIREKLFLASFYIAAILAVISLIGGVPPFIAILFGVSIFAASSGCILLPDSSPVKAFLRKALS